ncbi:MAG: L-ribulose-5-phosphate 3-epimerase [Blautia sp.]|nr:L-ribulose-5-phosphate 3-epimerase [Blautia sp.]MCM1201970.1 L-ribulose-5-phosphate 3-epimerase [Bacteroides fragilis]
MKNYSLGLYEKAMPEALTWREKLMTAREAGFDYIEISIDESEEKQSRLQWTRKQRAELVASMEACELPIRSMCLSAHRKYPLGSRDASVRKRGMEIMEQAIELADDLGIRTIQLAGYDVYYEETSMDTRQHFVKNLVRAAQLAADKGILLGFETMETSFMDTVEKAMEYVNLVNSPYLGVYPDIGNLTNAAKLYGTSVTGDLGKGAGHIIAMHLKETVPGVYREVPFGTGHVDFEMAIQKAIRLGVFRYVTELWYVGQENWIADVQDAAHRMKTILEQQLQ